MIKTVKYALFYIVLAPFCGLVIASSLFSATAETTTGLNSVVTIVTLYDFRTLLGRLESAVTKNDMAVVAKASASAGAETRGVTIRGDAVIMIFRNDFAVRMLAAKAEAGLEAPIPVHVYEAADGLARISYRPPSAVFHPYRIAALDAMAQELDPIFLRIVTQAATK